MIERITPRDILEAIKATPVVLQAFDDIEKFGIWPETHTWVYEKKWLELFIEGVLAPEFVATYAEGQRADRAKELENAANFNQQIDSSVLDEFVVHVYGDTAVVLFTQKLTGPSKGQPLTLTFRYMDVFVLRDGRWQCVASQSTRVTS